MVEGNQPVAPEKKFYKNLHSVIEEQNEDAPLPPPRPLIAPKLPIKYRNADNGSNNNKVKSVNVYPLEDDIYTGLQPELVVNKFYSNIPSNNGTVIAAGLPNDFIIKSIVNNNEAVLGLQNGKIVKFYTNADTAALSESLNNRQFYELIQEKKTMILGFQDTGHIYKLQPDGQLRLLLRDAIPMGRRKIYLRPEIDEIWAVGAKETTILAVNKDEEIAVVRTMTTHFPDAANLIFLDAEELAVLNRDRTAQIFSLPRFGHAPALIANIPAIIGDIVKVIKISETSEMNVYGTIYSDGKMILWKFNGDGKGLEEKVTVPLTLFKIQSVHSTSDKKFHWLGLNNGKIIVIKISDWEVKIVCEMKFHQAAVSKFIKIEGGALVSVDSNGQICVWDDNLTFYKQNKEIWEREEEYCGYERVRVRICSWNAAAQNPGDCSDEIVDKWLIGGSKCEDSDLIVISLQEIVDLGARNFINDDQGQNYVLDQWIRMAQRRLPNEFKLLHSSVMVGLALIVFCRETLRGQMGSVSEDSVKTGLGGLHGNKGGLAWRTFIYDTPVAFVACHLAAGQAAVSERNTDAATILRTAKFCEATQRRKDPSAFPTGNSGTRIFDHSAVFFAGDLNYRIDLDRSECVQKISERKWTELEGKDQLKMQLNRKELLLSCFREQRTNFAPTYKYDRGTLDRFDSSEKSRVPSWCDRILFYSKRPDTLHPKQYQSIPESTLSDHKPIYATFELKCRKINHPLRSLIFKK